MPTFGHFGDHYIHYHHCLHKKYGAGLIADLQDYPGKMDIDSMGHKDYFEKYLREPEGLDRLLSGVKAICKYEKPNDQIVVSTATLPYLSGVNNYSRTRIGDNINRVVVVFEKFPPEANSKPGESNGHFMLLWHFPKSFNKKEHARDKFCLFDPFGRTRKEDDPEEYYFQKGHKVCYQMPTSDTCALWTIFALIQFALQVTRVPGVEPVEYDGLEKTLDEPTFNDAHARQFRENERALYRYFLKHWFIFTPQQRQNRPLV
jgi:hypothetical protein